jgi:hypothetical protein
VQPPQQRDATAEGVANHPYARRRTVQGCQFVSSCRPQQVARQYPGLDPRGTGLHVDLDPGHPSRRHEDAVSREADPVAGRLHRYGHSARRGVLHGGGDVLWLFGSDDHRCDGISETMWETHAPQNSSAK